MPRPTRAQGRPGTRVIPTDWETSHAPVVEKTFTAAVSIYEPAAGTDPQLQADFTYTPGVDGDPIHTGGARIQVMNGQAAADILGDQQVITALYLVVISRAADVPVGSRVVVTDGDPMLTDGRRLIVRKTATGSLRWERDLWCVDDMTYQPTEPDPDPEPEPEGG